MPQSPRGPASATGKSKEDNEVEEEKEVIEMLAMNMIAASNSGFHTGVQWLLVGAAFSIVGVAYRYFQRNKSKEERFKIDSSLGWGRIFWIGIFGPPMMVVGVILILISKFK